MAAWRRFRGQTFRSKTCQFFDWRRGSANMLVTPDGWRGNFFNTWTRTASQFEALPILQLPSKAARYSSAESGRRRYARVLQRH
jgi:hypothetical protein